MVLKSPIPDIVIPEISLSDYVLKALKQFGDQQAMVNAVSGETFTFTEVYDRVVQYASLFNKMGIGKCDVVAIVASNSPDFIFVLLGTVACGAILTTCNPNYTKEEMVQQFSHSEPKLMVVNSAISPLIKEVAKTVKSIKNVLSIDGYMRDSIKTIVKTTQVYDFPRSVSLNFKEDPAFLPYSSGTTGLPKGVTLTHRNVVAMCEMCKIVLRITRRDTAYIIVPMFHIYGSLLAVNSLIQGSRVVVNDRFQLNTMFQHIQKYKISFLTAVPPMLLAMDQSPDIDQYDLSSLKRIMCGAAPLPHVVETSIMGKFKVQMIQAWGLSECVPITTVIDSDFPLTTTGVVSPNVLLKVIDTETGKELGPNQDGELVVKGPQVMKGYYKNPQSTAATFDKEGWLHTGDVGHYDDFGYVFVVDRLKELIKYKGFQVAPAELEAVLLRHPSINDVAVIGVPDHQAGEVPKAFVVTNDRSLNKAKIDRYLIDHVAKYKYLRGGVQFVDFIPKSPSGKILRRELRRQEKEKSKL